MKKYRLSSTLLLLLLSPFWPLFAGTDSLLRQLSTIPDDTNKVWALRDLAYYYLEKDLDSALFFSTQGYTLAGKLQFVPGQIWNLYQMGLAREFSDNFPKAMGHYQEAYRLARIAKDSLSQAKLLNIYGSAYYFQSDFASAIYYYTEAQQLSERIGYSEGQGHALNNLGIIYRHRRNFQKAQEMYAASLELKMALHDSVGIINSYYNLGLLYAFSQEYSKSLFYFQKAREHSLNLSSHQALAAMGIGLGVAYYHLGKTDEAYAHLQEGIKSLGPDKVDEEISAITYLGMIEISRGEKEKGLKRLLEAQARVENSDRLELRKVVARELATAYEQLRQPEKAVAFWKIHQTLSDSISSEQKVWATEEMQARYEAIEKDKKIRMQERELALERVSKMKLGLGLGGLLLAVIAAGWWWLSKKAPLRTTSVVVEVSPSLSFECINTRLPTPLTRREMEIILLLEEGCSNPVIAERLFVSENTIKTHLKNIYTKTEATSRTDLIHKLRKIQAKRKNHPEG
jgi:DNA-binding CsgD family transcriptional regulator/tetratricopeptide (TPR) repeat protein